LNSGLSIGALGALTAKENAQVFDQATGVTTEEKVEPAAGFGVLRLQQEFGKNASTAGIILSGMQRGLDAGEPLSQLLRHRALAGGADWNIRFQEGRYELSGNVGFSYVDGSKQSIADAQQSSAHYFQRPDADHVDFDPNRSSMAGWVARANFEKNSGEHWLWGGGVVAESPGFELNDMGRLGTADDIDSWAGGRYRETKPGKLFENWWVGSWVGSGWNFGGDHQYSFVDLETNVTWKNYMGSFFGVELYPESQNATRTRGGPSMGDPAGWNVAAGHWSNNKGRMTWNTFNSYYHNEIGGWSYYGEFGLTFRPGDRWEVTVKPNYNRWVNARQYIDTFDGGGPETYDSRYVFAEIERSRIVSQLRLNYAFTPDLTLELYAEPFASSGRYFGFGELEAARSKYLRPYGENGSTLTNNGDGTYTVDDGADSFSFEAEDFNYVSFRSNLVLRWEWSPGSTLFLVWQQNRDDSDSNGQLVRPTRLWDALSAEGDNFIAVKLTYWIPFL
jgi:hypothetical protein